MDCTFTHGLMVHVLLQLPTDMVWQRYGNFCQEHGGTFQSESLGLPRHGVTESSWVGSVAPSTIQQNSPGDEIAPSCLWHRLPISQSSLYVTHTYFRSTSYGTTPYPFSSLWTTQPKEWWRESFPPGQSAIDFAISINLIAYRPPRMGESRCDKTSMKCAMLCRLSILLPLWLLASRLACAKSGAPFPKGTY